MIKIKHHYQSKYLYHKMQQYQQSLKIIFKIKFNNCLITLRNQLKSYICTFPYLNTQQIKQIQQFIRQNKKTYKQQLAPMLPNKQKSANRKILAVTLYQLNKIIKNQQHFQPVYKNTNFEYIVFVVRLTSKNKFYVFTDQTDKISYEIKRIQDKFNPQVGNYYQCLCQLKSMNTTFDPYILNLTQVDGNGITTHITRLIKQGLQFENTTRQKQKEEVNQETHTKLNIEQLYEIMKQWVKSNIQFTLQQLQKQFSIEKYKHIFSELLTRLEEEEIIGNMGDFYRCID